MSQTSLQQQKDQDTRDLDPNVLQRIASNPDISVWVGASAGSGKTKVLTDRVLRLLLPHEKGQLGTSPHKILALTFTKAAASEMALRINKRLSEWAVIAEEELTEQLKNLLGQEATPAQIDAARKLFAGVVDTPGGLKIMTIHSFCQSILSRFPLEADLPPSFKALEESQAKILLKQARNKILKKAHEEKGSPLAEAIHHLASVQNEEQFEETLTKLISERRQLRQILEKNFGVEGLYTALCQGFEIPAGMSANTMIFEACENNQFDAQNLRKACAALAKGTPTTDQPHGLSIQNWLDADQKTRSQLYQDYKSAFLKKDGDVFVKLATNKVARLFPDIISILEIEAARIIALENNIKAANVAMLTRDLFLLGQEIITHYHELKSKENSLDFDDLILRTLDLLQGRTERMSGLDAAPWVRFKLDQGIDHILVDEAQDTNPEQWEIIKALCDDFFDGNPDNETERTIFVVGDKKQSIFSFQRASPEKFQKMNDWFADKITLADKQFERLDFITSFRSVPSILQLVDSVFESPEIRTGLDLEPLKHKAHRYTQAGLVELWPLFENPAKTDYDPWAPPVEVFNSSSGAAQMASYIGETIAGWIRNKEILESHDRPIKAGDIMILVRSRTAFIDQLVRSLKTRNIAVSGVDRMILSQQLVVQDLSAAAGFALLPEDDLTLAGLLKSPFIGWNEERLFDIAHGREGSLWQSVKKSGDEKTISYLTDLIKRAGSEKPYEFFARLLQEACPADNISGLRAIKRRLGEESLDPLDEFLNISLNFEADNTPALQNFIQAQLQNENQIKRQMEEAGNAVRIMTIHGAKGLQAPIVILPDTIRSANSGKPERILWPDRSGAKLPYFCPQSKQAPPPCTDALTILKQRQDEEYRRLLYVAMTRAENRLYIGGYKSYKPVIKDSWYYYVEQGFQNLSNVQEIKFGEKTILRFTNPATDQPDRADKNKPDIKQQKITEPPWLFQPMPEEPFPPRPLIPSRPFEQEAPPLSPLQSNNNRRFLRGNITHKLLQILPDLALKNRENAARKYVSQPAHNLPENIQEGIVSETLAILGHPDFAPIFGKGSLSEVPVTGLLDNKTLINAQIDRLLITDDEILIIDYKTNRPPPQNVKDVPPVYLNQMKAYADVMRRIYPNRTIKTALIWTDGARLMVL